MMRAPANPDPVKLKKDVDKLLRASAWWNRAEGRRRLELRPCRRYDWTSLTGLALIALAIVSVVLMVAWWRGGLRHKSRTQRVAALAGLTLFLCFDLVVFGAFTRLSDSGLGCPDWPGCYATPARSRRRSTSPTRRRSRPNGPVTRAQGVDRDDPSLLRAWRSAR